MNSFRVVFWVTLLHLYCFFSIFYSSKHIAMQDSQPTRDSTNRPHRNLTMPDHSVWPGRVDHIVDSMNRIVVLIVSCPYLDMADNVIHSMVQLNVTNFVVVPLDATVYRVVTQLYPKHVVKQLPGMGKLNVSDKAATYNSELFRQLTSTRPEIISAFLKQNYTVFYCDIDTVWRSRAVLDVLEAATRDDKELLTSELVLTQDSALLSEDKFCSCYIYAMPTFNNLRLLADWSNEIATNMYRNDQDAFQSVVSQSRRRFPIHILDGDDLRIPNGWFYFQIFNESQRRAVNIVHNNFIMGHERKRARFRQEHLWLPSGRLETLANKCSN